MDAPLLTDVLEKFWGCDTVVSTCCCFCIKHKISRQVVIGARHETTLVVILKQGCSTWPTYLSRSKTTRTELLELDQDQLVGKILMRMTPWQLETRCNRNVNNLVLSEQQRSIPLWSNPAVHTLLGKGNCFIPKARPLSMTEVKKLAPDLDTGWCELSNAMSIEDITNRKRRQWRRRKSEHGSRDNAHYQWSSVALTLPVFLNVKGKMEDYGEATNFFHPPLIDVSERLNLILSPLPARSCPAQETKLDPSWICSYGERFGSRYQNNADKNYGPTAYSQELAKEQGSLQWLSTLTTRKKEPTSGSLTKRRKTSLEVSSWRNVAFSVVSRK